MMNQNGSSGQWHWGQASVISVKQNAAEKPKCADAASADFRLGRNIKVVAIVVVALVGVPLIFVAGRFANDSIAPLFLNSRIERLGEKNLPEILVQGATIYCRMKADDFRFPLPPASRALNPVVTGGFDTVDGSVEARFDGANWVTASEYETSLSRKVQVG